MAFVVGVSLSDILVVLLMLTVLKNVDLGPIMHNIYVAIICGVGIIVMGFLTFRKKAIVATDSKTTLRFSNVDNTHWWRLMLNGFLLNLLNPFIWIYWLSIITVLSGEVGLDGSERYVFFAGVLLATLSCDLVKCRLASLLQTYFTARRLNLFNKVMGIVLALFGIYMIVSMVVYQKSPKIREKEMDNSAQSTKIIQSLHSHIAKDSSKHEADTISLFITE